ncbi:hypothetical protein CTRG_01634 [Candida tropicalis MYA-3404]|uniref:Serine/threonine-protein kinase BUR1 n=1 Tax=Candida tropicalis (strain ATCC MYA-3404 / T1) TaxID=294747 RepID=C5M703_CANTT|nr:hypothetical protein CTRG_01634 [Candida tropicalis MYA-3404]EER34773.1 hypothetical protein CTRG_01634 [Candida tropicalis MYA-3404]KAG4408650.1 hypothetical protein JTP64_001956 [Candida tropicalis]
MSVATSHNGSRLDDKASKENNIVMPRIPDTPPDSIGHIREMSQLKNYDIIEKLGQGTFGVVQKAKRKSDGSIVAIKQLLNHSAKEGFPITAMREITILKRLSHDNILSISDMIFEEAKVNNNAEIIQNRGSFYTVSPYMSSDLVGLLENPNIKLELNQIKCIMQQLFTGIQYIHDNNYLHRDIKAANILIDQYGILKIADFGLARVYHGSAPRLGMGPGGGEKSYTGLVVTRWYRPPEILLGERKYTTAVDIWGVGCVFAELFTGKPILVGKTDADQAKIVFELMGSPLTWPDAAKLPHKSEYNSGLACTRTLESRFEKIIPADGIKLLAGLLTLDPYKRFNALDALNHEFFKNDPVPLLPKEMPKFEESHEIDKERFKKMKDRTCPVSELKPPTEIQYDNRTESQHNTVYSSFGGDRDTRYTSGKSEYNYAGRSRYEQYESGRSRHEQFDTYIPKGPGDHRHHQDNQDFRGRNDYYDRNDNIRTDRDRDFDRDFDRDYGRHDRWESRDNWSRQYRDSSYKDHHASASSVNKIRESGDHFYGKYENYSKYNDRSKPESSQLPLSKSVPSLPSKPDIPSSFGARSSFNSKLSSANAIKIVPRDDRRVKLGGVTIREPARDPMDNQKENVETKEDGKKMDKSSESVNGKQFPTGPSGHKTPMEKVDPPKETAQEEIIKAEKTITKEESNKKEELVKKDETTNKEELLKKDDVKEKVEPVKVSEPTPVKSGEPAKIPSKLDTLRSTKVGSINLAMPKTKRATAIVASKRTKTISPSPSRVVKRGAEALASSRPVKKAKESKRNSILNIISDSDISDVEESADFQGDNERVFNDFVNPGSMMTDPQLKPILREKFLFNKSNKST